MAKASFRLGFAKLQAHNLTPSADAATGLLDEAAAIEAHFLEAVSARGVRSHAAESFACDAPHIARLRTQRPPAFPSTCSHLRLPASQLRVRKEAGRRDLQMETLNGLGVLHKNLALCQSDAAAAERYRERALSDWREALLLQQGIMPIWNMWEMCKDPRSGVHYDLERALALSRALAQWDPNPRDRPRSKAPARALHRSPPLSDFECLPQPSSTFLASRILLVAGVALYFIVSEHGPFMLYASMLMQMQVDTYVKIGEHTKAFSTNERLEQFRAVFAVSPADSNHYRQGTAI